MEKVKRKILFVIPSLNGGGAERVITHLVNHINRDKYIPQLLLIFDTTHLYLKNLKDDVQIIHLNISPKAKYYFLQTLIGILTQKPDIVFMGLSGINVLISPFIPLFRRIKWIARETSTLSKHVTNKRMLYLHRHFYKNYNTLIAQSETMANDLITNFNIPKEKIRIINNPIDTHFIDIKLQETKQPEFPEKKINLLICGSIKPVKGQDSLIKSFAELKERDNFHLTIIGESTDDTFNSNLQTLIRNYNIEDKVSFRGFHENSYIWLNKANIVVSSSRYEGFPNVVLEALYCGTPVLINNYGVAKEIITDGVNGYIFDFDKGNFEEKLKAALKRSFVSNKISKDTKEKYAVEKIMKEYELVFDRLN